LPNGINAYADTFFNLQTIGGLLNNSSLGLYQRTLGNNAGGSGLDTGNTRFDIIDFGARFFNNNDSTTRINGGAIWTGWSLGSRISSTSNKLYKNNTNTFTNTATNTQTSYSNINVTLAAMLSGTALFQNYQIAFFHLGQGLNDTEAANYYNSIQTFQTSLGRQV
jgi:hypothetical protein